jgi:methyl-accepting chemotaxis protein
MFAVKFRIGTKLAISAGAGLLMVGALAINELWDRSARAALAAETKNATDVQAATLAASTTMRRVVISGRDIRLSMTVAEVDEAKKRTEAFATEGNQLFDRAAAATKDNSGRQRLDRAKDLFGQFVAAVSDVASAKKEILELQSSLGDQGITWGKEMSAILASPDLKALANANEIIHALERADFLSASGRVSLWAFFVRGNADAQDRVKTALENSSKFLKEARKITVDAGVGASIDHFLMFAPRYQETIEKTLAAFTRLNIAIKDRADPLRIELDKLLDQVSRDLNAQTAEIEVRSANEESRSALIAWTLYVVVALILLGSAVFARMSVARPISRIGEVLMQLANGNKAVEIPFADRHDEVGDNARAAKAFKDNLLRIEKMEAEQKEAEARTAADRKAGMHKLAGEFQAAVGNIIDTVSSASTQLESAAGTLTRTAESTQQLSGMVASASEEASANVQSVASASEEMTSSVNEIARQVHESSKIASEAVKQAQKTDARITELSQAANRIGDVVKLITAIAEQTNLLALNATIEAARAGEAGKGFAVVAQEVKALAAQTAKATDEIGNQIGGMQAATQESVAAIKEIGTTIARISEIASTIAAAVEEQGAATQEISRNVQQAAQGTAQVATNITDVNRGASETGTASAQVLASAQSLSTESGHLKHEVEKFLATVRAA